MVRLVPVLPPAGNWQPGRRLAVHRPIDTGIGYRDRLSVTPECWPREFQIDAIYADIFIEAIKL